MKLKCIVGHPKQAFVPLPGSAFAFMVVLHLGMDWIWRLAAVNLGSIDKLAESHMYCVNMWPQLCSE